jgi:hypothetical protein
MAARMMEPNYSTRALINIYRAWVISASVELERCNYYAFVYLGTSFVPSNLK